MEGSLSTWGGFCLIIAGALGLIYGMAIGVLINQFGGSEGVAIIIFAIYLGSGFAGIVGGILAILKRHPVVVILYGIGTFLHAGGIFGFILGFSGILLVAAGWDEFIKKEMPVTPTINEIMDRRKKEQDQKEMQNILHEYMK